MQVSSGDLIFSGESNPYLAGLEKKKGKSKKLTEMLSQLSGMGLDEEDEESLKSFLGRPSNGKGAAPIYDPNKYYGGIYSMYGGRKVRGGLLGD